MQQVIAKWNPARGVWEKPIPNLLCEHWELFSEVWPSSGQMVTMPDGLVCVLPMPVRHTTDLGSLFLELEGKSNSSLFPTPISRDYKDSQAAQSRKGNVSVDTVGRVIFNSGEINYSTISWGKFEPAIRRWEQVLGRPAPAPTKPDGKDGAHRLSSAFTEWMMGLPEGWVTGCGLTRNEELKACGNGVVPQQAVLALRFLLDGVTIESDEKPVMLPTPTVMDQRDGKHFRSVAIKNLENGKNRGLNLNNVVEAIGVDWNEGDTFTMTEKGLKKNGNN